MADETFEAFVEATYAPGATGLERLRAARAEAGWPARRARLLARSGIDACDRLYEPKARCVLEELLTQIAGTENVARLRAIAERHPQRELRIRALHALTHSGPDGIDAAAGPRGEAPAETDAVALLVRARAAIARGDGPDHAASAPVPWRRALLGALRDADVSDAWLAFVLDAYFDPELARTAEPVLRALPPRRWRSLVAARKRRAPVRTRAKKPPAKRVAALDAELAAMRAALEEIVDVLRSEGFAFVRAPLSPPTKRFAAKLSKLEKRVGTVPIALARFWAVVGAVDFRGNHPGWAKKTWVASGRDEHWLADPIVVASLDDALADAEGGDFDVAEAPTALRYALDLCGDDLTKANFSGGIVSIETPSGAIDPPLRGAEGTFLGMLREAIAWGGFPGFAKIADAPPRPRRPHRE